MDEFDMARPVYTHELSDPDFSWLISSFRDNNPCFTLIEIVGLPLVFIQDKPLSFAAEGESVGGPEAGETKEETNP